ncbi:MAG: type VI secretion system contractile sheath large subunit [Maricaulaceae bacterium]
MTETLVQDAPPIALVEPHPDGAVNALAVQAVDVSGVPEGDAERREDIQLGLIEVLRQLFFQIEEGSFNLGEDRINAKLVEAALERIDQKISAQLDAVLHHKEFKELESAWRSLKYLVDHSPLEENIEVYLMNATKEDLHSDLDEDGVDESGYFEKLYTQELGGHGGTPFGAVVANFEFTPRQRDVDLLGLLASVSSMAHAPLIASAGPEFFGKDNWADLPRTQAQLAAVMADVKRYGHWNRFRETQDARYVGLTLPHFMLRNVYDLAPGAQSSFRYKENAGEDAGDYLWGNAAFAFAARMSESFRSYRWCMDVIGPQSGGQVEDLPTPMFMKDGLEHVMPPTQIYLSDNLEYILSDKGFVPLTMRKNANNAVFFAAQSAHRPKEYGNTDEARAAQANHFLSTQLPYTMLITRLAHFIKILQRENIGSWIDRANLQESLNKWIRNYIIANKPKDTRLLSERPLQAAEILVEDWPGKPGFFKVDMKVQPHIKYQGADFELSLVAQMEKSR